MFARVEKDGRKLTDTLKVGTGKLSKLVDSVGEKRLTTGLKEVTRMTGEIKLGKGLAEGVKPDGRDELDRWIYGIGESGAFWENQSGLPSVYSTGPCP